MTVGVTASAHIEHYTAGQLIGIAKHATAALLAFLVRHMLKLERLPTSERQIMCFLVY